MPGPHHCLWDGGWHLQVGAAQARAGRHERGGSEQACKSCLGQCWGSSNARGCRMYCQLACGRQVCSDPTFQPSSSSSKKAVPPTPEKPAARPARQQHPPTWILRLCIHFASMMLSRDCSSAPAAPTAAPGPGSGGLAGDAAALGGSEPCVAAADAVSAPTSPSQLPLVLPPRARRSCIFRRMVCTLLAPHPFHPRRPLAGCPTPGAATASAPTLLPPALLLAPGWSLAPACCGACSGYSRQLRSRIDWQ